MELNQGHMDFQSIALPPELRYRFIIASAKIGLFSQTNKFFAKKILLFRKKMYLCIVLKGNKSTLRTLGMLIGM